MNFPKTYDKVGQETIHIQRSNITKNKKNVRKFNRNKPCIFSHVKEIHIRNTLNNKLNTNSQENKNLYAFLWKPTYLNKIWKV